jgi:signal transduction histidine kinase/ActR/RegA family two-component response regulator
LILARGSPLFDDQGKPIRMLGSHVDITERAELEGQLRQAQRMESIGRLAGGIAHDFNNLLTVMLSTADLAMADLREGDPLRTDFLEIRHAVERAVALTRQLLAFSRKQVLQPAVLNLNTVIANMEKMLRRVIGEDVDLAVVPTEDLSSVTVDPGQIEQVIMNLAVNARDAMPDGGRLTVATQNIELDDTYAAQHASVRPGPYVMLAMSDTGVGMDEHTRARIFEPFFTTKERGKGTGLGLSTVFGIVEQSGGHIWVYSEVGKGTAFKIYLPSSAEGAPARGPARPAASTRGTETILVVEDEERLRHLIRRTLESAGYTVLAAANGGEALLLLERHEGTVHLMLTDVVMPGLGVRELAARVGALRQEARVLYMSGYTDDTIVRRGVLEQGIHFLPKPFAPDGLTRKVREVLDAEP